MSVGSRPRRSPSSSCRLSGIRSAWPRVGLVLVRTSSRPSSSAKNALPPVASQTRTSSGRVSSRPSRSSRSVWTAPTLSGPSEICSIREAGKVRSSSTGLPMSGPSLTVASSRTCSSRRRRSAIWTTPADAGSSHWRSSSATRTGPRSARAHKRSSTARPIACASGVASPGSTRRRATSSARRRGGSNESATSSKTGASSSDSPAKDRDASASTPRHVST